MRVQETIREIAQRITHAEAHMTNDLFQVWNRIKIVPEKWTQSPWGDKSGGFWVIAVMGKRCIYYNDIEDGFDSSPWSTYGTIDEYWCNQDDLLLCLRTLFPAVSEPDGYDG